MENLLLEFVGQLPNLGVAVAILWWQSKTIERLLNTQEKLIDQLLTRAEAKTKFIDDLLAAESAMQP